MQSLEKKQERQRQLAYKLDSDHDRLEQWFLEIAQRAVESRECDAVWSEFTQQLENHMAFEERDVFPYYASVGVAEAKTIQGLLTEHVELRRQLQSIGVDLQLHLTSAPVIAELLRKLRAHAKHEKMTLYSWLAAQPTSTAAFAGESAG